MKTKPNQPKTVAAIPPAEDPITAYSVAQAQPFREICDQLRTLIEKALPEATSQVWHGSPVWFIAGNPVVGYNATAKTVNLLFWNGKAFAEPALQSVGKYQAAQAKFSPADNVDTKTIRCWLKLARENVLDSKAFFKALREAK